MSARAYQVRELIEEERLLKDQLADFWEPRFMDERLMQQRPGPNTFMETPGER